MCPLIYCRVKPKLIFIGRLEFLYFCNRVLIKVEIKCQLGKQFHDCGISQFPDREWASLKETFNAVFTVLEVQLWSKILFRHALKDCPFDFFVNNLALKLPIK